LSKEQKAAVVDELSKELSESEAIFAIDYRGISVPQAAELRAGLRDADARFRVVKNRLTLLAADKAGTAELKEHLEGPTALALVHGDAAAAAKTIFRLGREWEVLSYKGGLMAGEVLDEDTFVEIARLPGRDQLDAQFAGIVASPLTGLVRGLGSMVQGLALQLQAIADQGLVAGEAPAEEAPADEEETPKEVDAPAADAAEEGSDDEGSGGEDASSDEAVDGPSSEADPEPEASPEEAPSEEEAPSGETAGEGAEAEPTGEGDAEMGEAAEEAQDDGEDSGGDEASEDSDANKEEGS
jgi:large subunit ribosomal protein L10